MSEWFQVRELEEGVWAIREPYHHEGVVSYLLVGDSQALLIDTGMGLANIREVAEDLTPFPLMVVNTHSHFDHIGCNHRFEKIAIHQSEARRLERGIEAADLQEFIKPDTFRRYPSGDFDPADYRIRPSRATRPLKDSDILTIGDRNLEVLHTPGHSPGSICLWEKDRGLLFTGDTIYKGPLYAQLPHSDFEAYQSSVSRLCAIAPQTRLVLPSHGPIPLEPLFLFQIAKVFQQVAQGGIEYSFGDSLWGPIRIYQQGELILYVK